jgi:hypothetical protein
MDSIITPQQNQGSISARLNGKSKKLQALDFDTHGVAVRASCGGHRLGMPSMLITIRSVERCCSSIPSMNKFGCTCINGELREKEGEGTVVVAGTPVGTEFAKKDVFIAYDMERRNHPTSPSDSLLARTPFGMERDK